MISAVDTSRWAPVDLAVLVLRVGIGVSFVFVYGADKITGGPSTWIDLGQNMAIFGVTFWPTFWGFMAALTEFGGGLLLMLGLFFRPALAFLLITMTVATASHLAAGEGPWHATEMATVFVALFLLGPGRYSLDAWLWERPDAEGDVHAG
ncbi:MAG: DoxX family protein [Salinibacter sp.]